MRNLAEAVATLTIGDGVVGPVAPRRHSLLWEFGPEGYRRAMEALAGHPGAVRGFAGVGILAGLWLALGQHREE